jgi:hypothetical protein
MDIIGQCYHDGHQFSSLSMIPNQYDDDFFKSSLQGLINGKMVDIVRVANEKRSRCEEYTAIDMTVNSLAVWHSYLGHHARWVLGVRHDKESDKQGGVCLKHGPKVVKRKRKYSSQNGCKNQVQQGGVCLKHERSVTSMGR